MELLNKTISPDEEKRRDNSDKKELFPKTRHPRKASEHREDWKFVQNEKTLENLSYQLQYLEFMVHLYNDYQIYLTIESLMCKNIMVTIAGIVECVLFDLIEQASKNVDFNISERRDFLSLIGICYDMQYYSKETKDAFHELRKIRNLVHLTGTQFQEYSGYTIEETNRYLQILEDFQKEMSK